MKVKVRAKDGFHLSLWIPYWLIGLFRPILRSQVSPEYRPVVDLLSRKNWKKYKKLLKGLPLFEVDEPGGDHVEFRL